jgi:cytidyltransferase-like protein
MIYKIREKIKELDELGTIALQARESGKAVVHAHGTFDLLHLGHVRHLAAARTEGDVLVVTVTADRHVNKGPGRPVFPQASRRSNLSILSRSTTPPAPNRRSRPFGRRFTSRATTTPTPSMT